MHSLSIRTIRFFHYSLPPQFLSVKWENLENCLSGVNSRLVGFYQANGLLFTPETDTSSILEHISSLVFLCIFHLSINPIVINTTKKHISSLLGWRLYIFMRSWLMLGQSVSRCERKTTIIARKRNTIKMFGFNVIHYASLFALFPTNIADFCPSLLVLVS